MPLTYDPTSYDLPVGQDSQGNVQVGDQYRTPPSGQYPGLDKVNNAIEQWIDRQIGKLYLPLTVAGAVGLLLITR
jgi:hypothetical protein